ncbi:hypothetical protein L9F63_000825, partial [Diploptera punctata]
GKTNTDRKQRKKALKVLCSCIKEVLDAESHNGPHIHQTILVDDLCIQNLKEEAYINNLRSSVETGRRVKSLRNVRYAYSDGNSKNFPSNINMQSHDVHIHTSTDSPPSVSPLGFIERRSRIRSHRLHSGNQGKDYEGIYVMPCYRAVPLQKQKLLTGNGNFGKSTVVGLRLPAHGHATPLHGSSSSGVSKCISNNGCCICSSANSTTCAFPPYSLRINTISIA